jgi:hypothetical protein
LAALLFYLPPLTWIATGLLAAWLAARRGKSWRWGFALGFFCSTAGVVLAALPRRSSNAKGQQEDVSGPGQGNVGVSSWTLLSGPAEPTASATR